MGNALSRLRRAAATAWPRPTVKGALQFDNSILQDHVLCHYYEKPPTIQEHSQDQIVDTLRQLGRRYVDLLHSWVSPPFSPGTRTQGEREVPLRNTMTLKDLLKKKDSIKEKGATFTASKGPTLSPDVPEFQFLRTTTSTQETIEPPSFPGDPTRDNPLLSPEPRGTFGRFRRHSNAASPGSQQGADDGKHKLTERLHFGRTRSSSSVNVPDNLPDVGGDGVARTEEEEASWEKRATVLVTEGLHQGGSVPGTPSYETSNPMSAGRPTSSRSRSGTIGAPADEVRKEEHSIPAWAKI